MTESSRHVPSARLLRSSESVCAARAEGAIWRMGHKIRISEAHKFCEGRARKRARERARLSGRVREEQKVPLDDFARREALQTRGQKGGKSPHSNRGGVDSPIPRKPQQRLQMNRLTTPTSDKNVEVAAATYSPRPVPARYESNKASSPRRAAQNFSANPLSGTFFFLRPRERAQKG